MKALSVLVLFLFISGVRLGGQTLVARAVFHLVPLAVSDTADEMIVWLYLKNVSDRDVKIPTRASPEGGFSRDTRGDSIDFWYGPPDMPVDESELVLSEIPFAPVVMKPNQETVVIWRGRVPRGVSKVRIKYTIQARFARRMGFWSGSVVADGVPFNVASKYDFKPGVSIDSGSDR